MWKCALLPLLLVAAPAVAAEPPPLAEPVRKMLEAVIAGGNENDISAVAKVARQTNPGAIAEIDAMVNAHRVRKEEQRQVRIARATMLELWDGKVELGGFRSTGSTSEVGISAGVSLTRSGLQWTHRLSGSVDYRRANGRTSRERFVAAYEPRYQFDPGGFVYGLVQFERDPFIGFDSRYAASAGIGYKLIQSKAINLSVDAGPSVRRVEYTDDFTETKFGGRSSLNFGWKLSPTLNLRQTASGYFESDVITLSAQTALDARIVSRLTARLSYNVLHETESRLTGERLDTLSKVTLIYDF